MEELNELGISGLAVSVVDDKESIPKSLIKRANELCLPLFKVRWKGASFVDISQSIGNLILETNIMNKRTGDYLYNLHYEIANRVNERLGSIPASNAEASKTSETIYRVRKSADDSKTQIGAYKTLANAKKQADANQGYFVFDKDGVKIYPIAKEQPKPVAPSFQPYKVEVTASNLRIRKGAGTDTAIVGMCPKGVYTITEEKRGQGASKWGKLKSGAGWISLDYVKKC